jgi:hypothetical protein
MYKILIQFQPGFDGIWVEQLTESDPIYIFSDEASAEQQAVELQSADSLGRQYKVVPA